MQNKTELSPSFFTATSSSPFAPAGDDARSDEPTGQAAEPDVPVAPTWGESVWNRTQADDHAVAVRSDPEPTSLATEQDWDTYSDVVSLGVSEDFSDIHPPSPFATSPFATSPFATSPFGASPSVNIPLDTVASPFAPTTEATTASPSNPGHSPFAPADSFVASPFSGALTTSPIDATSAATGGPTWSTGGQPVPEPFAPAPSTVWGDLPQPPAPPPSFDLPPIPHPVESFRPLAGEVIDEFASRPFHELAAAHLRPPVEPTALPAAEAFVPSFELVQHSFNIDPDAAHEVKIESVPTKRRFRPGRKTTAATNELADQSADLMPEVVVAVAKPRRFTRTSSVSTELTDGTTIDPPEPATKTKNPKATKSDKSDKSTKPAKGAFFAKQTEDELLLAKSNAARAPMALRVAAIVSLAAGIGLFGYTVVRGTTKAKVDAPVSTVAPPPNAAVEAPTIAAPTPPSAVAPTVMADPLDSVDPLDPVDPIDPLTPVPTQAPSVDGDPTATPTVPPAGDDLSFSSGSDFTA